VAFLLNKAGILTKKGKNWTAATVRKVLTDPIYVGIYSVAGVKDYVEEYRMLDDSIFLRINETRLRYRSRGNNKPSKPSVPEDRKSEQIERMFEKYFKLLKEDEQ